MVVSGLSRTSGPWPMLPVGALTYRASRIPQGTEEEHWLLQISAVTDPIVPILNSTAFHHEKINASQAFG